MRSMGTQEDATPKSTSRLAVLEGQRPACKPPAPVDMEGIVEDTVEVLRAISMKLSGPLRRAGSRH